MKNLLGCELYKSLQWVRTDPQGFPGGLVSPAMQETQKMQVWSLGQENPLEEGMPTHSSILVWEIPQTEEHEELQSIGLQKQLDMP